MLMDIIAEYLTSIVGFPHLSRVHVNTRETVTVSTSVSSTRQDMRYHLHNHVTTTGDADVEPEAPRGNPRRGVARCHAAEQAHARASSRDAGSRSGSAARSGA